MQAQQLPTPAPQPKAVTSTKRRILIVDDDPDIADTLRIALQHEDFEVMVAGDGNRGLAMLQDVQPNLMILDMMMPKRSGFLVLETLRQSDMPPIPVIMITSNEGQRHKKYAEMLGVDVYLQKPFDVEALMSHVHRLLS